jgi:acyl carrier protein
MLPAVFDLPMGPSKIKVRDEPFWRMKPPIRVIRETAGIRVARNWSMDTLAKVQEVIAEQMKRPLSEVTPDSRLEDLGDSLDLIEVIYALEVAFKVDIPLNSKELEEKLETVSDVGKIIDRLIAERDAA